jgi:hypothetical protein
VPGTYFRASPVGTTFPGLANMLLSLDAFVMRFPPSLGAVLTLPPV